MFQIQIKYKKGWPASFEDTSHFYIFPQSLLFLHPIFREAHRGYVLPFLLLGGG
jgi:hypothetical protein